MQNNYTILLISGALIFFWAGTLVFDYTLRPGVVTKSNALELMRSVGLEVENEGKP